VDKEYIEALVLADEEYVFAIATSFEGYD